MAARGLALGIVRGISSVNTGRVHRSSLQRWRFLSTGAPETNSTEKTETEQTASDLEAAREEWAKSEKQLKEEKETLTKKFDEINDKYKRSLAETENVRQRMQKQIDDAKLFGIQGFCKDLLEVADILNKATESITEEQLQANTELRNMFDGLNMTETQLQKVFTKNGLIKIDPAEGDKFNPNIHEALFQQSVAGKEADTVAVVTKIGYQLHHRTLRPAVVGVYK